MKLTDLEPHFIKFVEKTETWNVVDGDQATWRERGSPTKPFTGRRTYLVPVESLADAQSIMFLCPKCFVANGGSVGSHSVEVTFADRGVPDHQGCHGTGGAPTRWTVSGTNFADLSTTPSILLIGGCGWHGFITNGEVSII